jgi:hypothetical protein
MKHMKLKVIAGAMIVAAAATNLALALEPLLEPNKGVAERNETKSLEVTLTPSEPYLLPDGLTKIVVKKESIHLGRAGRTGTVQVLFGDSVLTLIPRTVIYAGGYRFEFNTAPSFEFGQVREEDMIFTIVERCRLTVRSSRQETPPVALQELHETIEMRCSHGRVYTDLYTIRGDGQHFLSLKPKRISISSFHPDPELGAKVEMDIINNAGAKSITLAYKKQQQVTLGHETITLESSGFDYETKTMKVRVSTRPNTAKAAATIVEYGAPPAPPLDNQSGRQVSPLRPSTLTPGG